MAEEENGRPLNGLDGDGTMDESAHMKKEQAKLRGQITRGYNNARSGMKYDLEKLQEAYANLLTIEEVLYSEGMNDDEQDKVDEYVDKMVEVKRIHEQDKKKAKPKPSNLKAEKPPQFDGTYQKWDAFINVFKRMIDENDELEEYEKERYLLTSCKGDAEMIIMPFAGKPNGYPLMMAALKDHYDNLTKIKENILESVRKLPFIAYKFDEKVKEFKTAAQIIVNIVKERTDEKDDFRQKLTKELIGRWGMKLRLEFLSKHSTMEEVITVLNKFYQERERLITFDVPLLPNQFRQNGRLTTGAVTSEPDKCGFCDKGHRTHLCDANLTVEARRKAAGVNRLCYLCLKRGHRSQECTFKRSCGQCGKRHHTLLHIPSGERVMAQGNRQVTTAPVDVVETALCGVAMVETTGSNSPIIRAFYNGRIIRILLDSGSRLTLIKRSNTDPGEVQVGQKKLFDGVGGVRPSTEVAMFQVASMKVKPINLYAYVMDRLPGNMDIIIGEDQMYKLMKQEALTEDKKCYFDTVFGMVKFGNTNEVKEYLTACIQTENPAPIKALSELYDEITMDVNAANELKECDFEIEQRSDGRYEAALPLIGGQTPQNNFNQAFRRLVCTQNRLKKHGLVDTFEKQLDQYEKNGHAVRVLTKTPQFDDASYMPTQEVIKLESETTSVRIVFDASAGSPSLNDLLHKGWTDSLNLIDRLMDFRQNEVAITADIEKAFLQVGIRQRDQDWIRYLWKRDGQLEVYKMKVLPFGLVCSPAILMKTLQKHVRKFLGKYPITAALLLVAFYMDDFVTSLLNLLLARQVMKEAIEILSGAGFNLRKWKSNNPELQKEFGMEESKSVTSVLGVVWDCKADVLSLKIEERKAFEVITKRIVLQCTNSVFDPLGLIEPVKLKLKVIVQQIWTIKVDWDEALPAFVSKEFEALVLQMPRLKCVQIPRLLQSAKPLMVNFFSDACKVGYGYEIFLTLEDKRNVFMRGKSRVAPTSGRTIPDLELAALTEAVEAVPFHVKQFKDLPILVWSDSEVTLKRLNMPVNKCGTYVNNRVLRVHSVCQSLPIEFKFIRGKDNPADHYSRPLSVDEFLKEKPHECDLDFVELAKVNPSFPTPSYNVSAVLQPVKAPRKEIELVDLVGFEGCSEWAAVIRRAKFFLKGINNWRSKCLQQEKKVVSVNDALNLIYKKAQESCLESLVDLKLPYFHDEQGVIRIRTRDSKNTPVWIPKNSRMAVLIVRFEHQRGLHCGKRFTKALVMDRHYIPGLDAIAYAVRKSCVVCQKRWKDLMEQQPVGQLPEYRTRIFGPFQCIGVDCFGPIELNDGTKANCLLATCGVSRAIDIEILENMSASACLKAMNAIFLRKGIPEIVISDNGTNFIGCNRDLRAIYKAIRVAAEKIPHPITWKFIPPHTPWWGGLYERMIGTVKRSAPSMNNCNSKEDLRYVLLEAISVVNSRPLFEDDGEIITPAHYFLNRSLLSLPSGYGAGEINSIKAYRKIKRARNRFIKLWKPMYLQALALQGTKENRTVQKIEIGDAVLVREPGMKREDWNLAKVTQLLPGPDGIVRTVKVVYAKETAKRLAKRRIPYEVKEMTRSTSNLVRLELSAEPPKL